MNTFRTSWLIPVLFVSGTLLLTACDSNDEPDDNDLGRFQAAITGSVQMSLDGLAGYGVEVDPDSGAVFAVALISASDNEDVILLAGRGTPTERSYPLDAIESDGETGGVFFLHTMGENGVFYLSDGGTLTLTAVRSDRLEGRFEFTAVNVLDEDDTVTLQGTFNARKSDDGVTGERRLLTR